MKLLLDTHIALWAIVDDARLPAIARNLLTDPSNDVFISSASVWEIALKHGLARGLPSDMPISGADALAFFRRAGFRLLSITAEHAAAIAALPRRHADPFDRMIVTQALAEPLRLVTHDQTLGGYSDTIMVV